MLQDSECAMKDSETTRSTKADKEIKRYICQGKEFLEKQEIATAEWYFRMGLKEIDRHYRPNILRFCYYMLFRYNYYAEDASQETFIAVLKQLKKFDINTNISSWLHGIARHKCVDILRMIKSHKFVPIYEDYEDSHFGIPESYCETLEHLNIMLSKLTNRERAVFIQSYIENMSSEEIARSLNIVNINSYHKVAERLRKKIEQIWKEIES